MPVIACVSHGESAKQHCTLKMISAVRRRKRTNEMYVLHPRERFQAGIAAAAVNGSSYDV